MLLKVFVNFILRRSKVTQEQIKKLLQQALKKSNTDGPCYDVGKLVIQIELIISMLDDTPTRLPCGGKDIGDIK
jgi:hypothetical protein